MGVMDYFKSTPAPAPASPAASAPNANNPAASATTPQAPGQVGVINENAGGDPAANDPKTGKPVSPLDKYKGLWQSEDSKSGPKDAQGNPVVPPKKESPFDPAKLKEHANKLSFSRLVPPDVLAKAFPGGDAATIGQILDAVGRAAFASASSMSSQIAGHHVKEFQTTLDADLPNRFKNFSLSNSTPKNPAFRHEAIQPWIEATKQQMAAKFPSASTSEVETMAEEYVQATLEEINKNDPSKQATTPSPGSLNARVEQVKAQEKGEFDWAKEFGLS